MKITTKNLGLSAFIKMNGCTLLGVAGREFTFESDLTLEDWMVKYSNSCCMRHDTLVCELRKHLSPS